MAGIDDSVPYVTELTVALEDKQVTIPALGDWDHKVKLFSMLKQDIVSLITAQASLNKLEADPNLALTKEQWALLQNALAVLGTVIR